MRYVNDRIERLLKNFTDGEAVFVSGYPNIFYYSGFTSEDAWLIITESKRIIATDSRYFVQARLEAPEFDIFDIDKGWEKLFAEISNDKIAFEENKMSFGEYQRLKEKSGKRFVAAQEKIDRQRRVKDEHEIECIRDAEEIGDAAFSHILTFIKAGMTEKEVALELEYFMKKQGASAMSFPTIAASGVRSAMPHGVASDKIIEKGDLLTLDFGCVFNGYCSDMTRTVGIGSLNLKQIEIYNTVLKAQSAAVVGIHEGISCFDADKLARDIITEAGYGENFGHSLGHSVGVEIHEKPLFSKKSKDILEEGNVLSVEPGIYIDGFGGVRIEDLIAVKNGEIINLTTSPKDLIVI